MAGRPRIKIDWEVVDKYAEAGCSAAVIARKLKINPRSFYAIIKRDKKMEATVFMHQKHEEGIAEIVLKAYEDAKKNPISRIFWLKNKAGWSDKGVGDKGDLPTLIQINLGNSNADPAKVKMIENFFNGRILDSSVREEPRSLPEGQQTDNK